jgi:hypothetical protein
MSFEFERVDDLKNQFIFSALKSYIFLMFLCCTTISIELCNLLTASFFSQIW